MGGVVNSECVLTCQVSQLKQGAPLLQGGNIYTLEVQAG